MNKKAIIGSKMILCDCILENHVLLFSERIEAIVTPEAYREIKAQSQSPVEEIHFEGTLMPGFIDIHIHGAKGHDVMDGTFEALDTVAKAIVKTGTTAFLATTMTMSQPDIEKTLNEIRKYMTHQKAQNRENHQNRGAEVLGVHLEGPFINPMFKGAQDETHIQKPTKTWIEPYFDIIRMITYAPEMDCNFEFAKAMEASNIVLSIGHSGSDFETALSAYDAGVKHITHCFNAVTGLHHRKPGVVGAALSKPFTLDLIADGVHIHPGFIGPFIKLKGVDKTILITDAMRAALMPEGNYDLGGQRTYVKDCACRLEDGTLAGSVLSTAEAMRNILNFTAFELVDIVKMLSENPAKLLKIYDEMGSIEPNKRANLILLDDEREIQSVYIDGVICYSGGIQ